MTAVTQVAQTPSVQLTHANLAFEIRGGVTPVQKVEQIVEYCFTVVFHPSGHPATLAQREVKVPIYAKSLVRALMILQAYGKTLTNKTEEEIQKAIDALPYSSVVIDQDEKGHDLRFTQFDPHLQRFAQRPHIQSKITSKEYNELQKYAAILQSQPAPQEEEEDPEIILERREIEPEIELVQTTKAAGPELSQKERCIAIRDRVKSVLLEHHQPAKDEDLESLDGVFGKDFFNEFKKTNPEDSVEDRLFWTAYQHWVLQQEAIKQGELLSRVRQELEKGGPSATREAFFYMLDKAAEAQS